MTERESVTKEGIKQPGGVLDILNENYVFHWTAIKNLPKIFSRGLYAPSFAQRIEDKEYQFGPFSPYVWLTRNPKQVWGGRPSYESVAIVMDRNVELPRGSGAVRLRVSPSQFIGLVITDGFPPGFESIPFRFRLNEYIKTTRPFAVRRVNELKKLFELEGIKTVPLPIYGISGDLYWPRKISHAQIVEMLKGRT